jgi:hypothetical protein
VSGEFDAATAEQKRRDLLTYCALDTRAMVEILQTLHNIGADWTRHVAT